MGVSSDWMILDDNDGQERGDLWPQKEKEKFKNNVLSLFKGTPELEERHFCHTDFRPSVVFSIYCVAFMRKGEIFIH